MTREQLEHLIRAAADIANDDEIVVIGSQAIVAKAIAERKDVLAFFVLGGGAPSPGWGVCDGRGGRGVRSRRPGGIDQAPGACAGSRLTRTT